METVKDESKTEETQTEPFMVVTEESKVVPAETELIITEPEKEPKAQTEKPKEPKREKPRQGVSLPWLNLFFNSIYI